MLLVINIPILIYELRATGPATRRDAFDISISVAGIFIGGNYLLILIVNEILGDS